MLFAQVVLWVFKVFSRPATPRLLARSDLDAFNTACGDGVLSDETWEWLKDSFAVTAMLVRLLYALHCAVEVACS